MSAPPLASLPSIFPRIAPPTALPPMMPAFFPALPVARRVNPASIDAEWPSGATIRLNEIDSAPPVSLKPFLADLTSLILPSTRLPAGNATRSPAITGFFNVALTLSPTCAVPDVIASGIVTAMAVPAGIVTTTGGGAAGCAGAASCRRSSGIVPVFFDGVRTLCGRAGGAGFCSGGGACSCPGDVLPATLVSLSGGGACSVVSGVLLLWPEH